MASSPETMAKKRRSKSRVPDDEDGISNLPDSVIGHILSFLPTKNVVGTGVLSTGWKLLWTQVTTLDFIHKKEEYWSDEEETRDLRKFVRFVNYVLVKIDSQRLQKFRLEWVPTPNMEVEHVPIWINYAIARSVRELVIDLREKWDFVTLNLDLPGTLFTCATFQVLKLRGYLKFQVPSVVCLPKLEVLDLQSVLYESNECLPKILRACPVLLSLTIGRDDQDTMNDIRVISPSLRRLEVSVVRTEPATFGKLEIDAPNLEYFKLDETLEECSVKRLNSLNFVELNLEVEPFQESDDDDEDFEELCIGRYNSAVNLVETMSHVKFMTLKPTIIKALSDATTPLSVCFERLIKLDVTADYRHWSSLGDILGRSTKLQVLNMTIVGSCGTDHKVCWNDPTKVPECLSSSLQKVSLLGFGGLEDQMAMISYILQHSEVLESLTLKPRVYDLDINQRYQLLKHVSTFPRCSRACQIHFD